MSDLVRIQTLLPKKQRDELREIARREGKSLSELIREFLSAELRNKKYTEMRLAAEQLLAEYEEGGPMGGLTSMN
jgi:hypothetical protein